MPSSKREWKRRYVLLRPHRDAALEDAALQEGWTVSVLIRHLIERYLRHRKCAGKADIFYREKGGDKSPII